MGIRRLRPGRLHRKTREHRPHHRHEEHIENMASSGGIYGHESAAWGHEDNERYMRAMHPELFEPSVPQPHVPTIRPASAQDRSRNPLRPQHLEDVVGQDMAKRTLRKVIDKTAARGEPLPHMLFVGAAGTGKSTFSHVLANETGAHVYTVAAPVNVDQLLELRETMLPHDILQIEEIHLQSSGDRRGRTADTAPEVLYSLLEDRVLITSAGPLPFPRITVVGTTTDEGQLPDAFIRRFPLRPHLEPYTVANMRQIAAMNAQQLDVQLTSPAAEIFGRASRLLPWQINTFVQAGVLFAPADRITAQVAREVLKSMSVALDGLTADMQDTLTFIYRHGRRETADGTVTYQASVQSIATALGHSRDSKAIILRVEPWLIQQGFVQVLPQGRRLTDTGITRAQQLLRSKP